MNKKIMEGIAGFIADIGAKYRKYVDAEAVIARQQAMHQKHQVIRQNMQLIYNKYYLTVLELLMEAVNNTSETIGIVHVRNIESLMAHPPVSIAIKGFYYFKFRGLSSFKQEVTAGICTRVLQRELDELVQFYNFPRLYIQAKYQADRFVLFNIAFYSDIQKVINL